MPKMNEQVDALEILEDEEDIREGLEALADYAGTINWEEYLKSHPAGRL